MATFNISDFFTTRHSVENLSIYNAKRTNNIFVSGQFLIDQFDYADCVFIRLNPSKLVKILIDGSYRFEQVSSGGYLGVSSLISLPSYWIPLPLKTRKINSDNQILHEQTTSFSSFSWSEHSASFSIEAPEHSSIDLIVWRLSSRGFTEELISTLPIEKIGHFLWGSHNFIAKPADLYRHLIQGVTYDLRFSWPHKKKCFSENEAHVLYTTYTGLEKSTGKSIYRCFQLQLVLSIIQRQSDDGGWYHGMWTDDPECHYRLHTAGIHMLLDEYARSKCPKVKTALEKAVNFLSKTTDQLECGAWFLHDSLELTEAAMNKGPFRWIANKTLGKRVSNMLVLNTHLDSTIAINRYAQLTGDRQYDELIDSALDSTRTVLSLKPAEWLYKPLFWAIGLTMLPTETAKRLPLPIRAIKRIASEYLIKVLPDIKARFPRLVMPNGYIDRELSLRTWAIDYQTINLMDLCRYAHAFPGQLDEFILEKALEFTQTSGLIKRYQELPSDKQYAPGFWAEALYYRCLSKPDIKYRHWLVDAIIQNRVSGLGLSPSLMGTNGEAVPYEIQTPLLEFNSMEIIAVNLSYGKTIEYILINLSDLDINISEKIKSIHQLNWKDSQGYHVNPNNLKIKGANWITGKN